MVVAMRNRQTFKIWLHNKPLEIAIGVTLWMPNHKHTDDKQMTPDKLY